MKALCKVVSAGLLGTLALAPLSASAATDIFLKLDGIVGESLNARHKDEIELLSYSQSVSRAGSSRDRDDPLNCGVINVQKRLDKASVSLIGDALSGRVIASGVVSFVNSSAGNQQTYEIDLTDVVVSRVSQSDSSSADVVIENVSFRVATYTIKYRPALASGAAGSVETITVDCRGESVR